VEASRVPVPQQPFDEELLSIGVEAFWSVREAAAAGLRLRELRRSGERDGARDAASSEVDDDRGLPSRTRCGIDAGRSRRPIRPAEPERP
jgi:uncharacterized membrane protein